MPGLSGIETAPLPALRASAARALAGSARTPPPGRGARALLARQALDIQRTAGNAAAVRLLQRQKAAVAAVVDTTIPPYGTAAEVARWTVARVKAVKGRDLVGVYTADQLILFDAASDPAEKDRCARGDKIDLSPGLWDWNPGSYWGHLEAQTSDLWLPAPGLGSPDNLVVPGLDVSKLRVLLSAMPKNGEFYIAVPGPAPVTEGPPGPEPGPASSKPAGWALAQYNAALAAIEKAKRGLAGVQLPAGQPGYDLPDRVILLKPSPDGKQYVNVWVGKAPAPNVWGQHVRAIELKEGESTESLVGRIRAGAADLRSGLDPSASVGVKGGATGQAKFTGKPAEGEIVFPPDAKINPTGGRKVTDPAFPARIVSHGPEGNAGNNQYELTVIGATVHFTMDLDFAAVTSGFWEEFGARWQTIAYRWEIIDISSLDLEAVKGKLSGATNAELRKQVALLRAQAAAAKNAKDQKAADAADKQAAELLAKIEGTGEDPASGAGRDIGRDLANTWEDTKADIWDTALQPGFESYMGVVAVSDIVRVGGSLISAGLSELAAPSADRSIGFGRQGLYMLRCYAQPVITDDDIARIEQQGLKPIIRAPSVAYLPIKVVPIEKRAQQVNDAELGNIAALEAQAAKPVFPDTKEDAAKRLKEAKDALGRNNEEAVAQAIQAARDELQRVKDWRALAGKALEDPARSPELRIWHAKLDVNGIDLDSYEKDLGDALTRLGKMLTQVGRGKSGFMSDRPFRPRVTLVSELDGHAYTVLCNLGEAKGSKPGARIWRLVDVSADVPKPPAYQGVGETHSEAITNAFALFAEKNEYGRGTIAVRMPPEGSFQTAVDNETIAVPPLWRSAPGLEERAWKRLQDLATATEIAGLFISGPLGAGLMIVGGVAGGLVALHNMQKRAAIGKFEWLDFQTAMDIMAVVGAFMMVGGVAAKGVESVAEASQLARRARWGGEAIETAEEAATTMAKVAKAANWTGRVIHVMGTGMLAGQVITIPAGAVLQLARIDQAEQEEQARTGHADATKFRAQRLEVLAGALRSIATTVRMAQLMTDPKAGWDPFREPAPETALSPGAVKAQGPAAGLPPDLNKVVPVEVDPALGDTNTVRVTYEIDPQTKVVTRVRMRLGSAATAKDVQLHAPTARALLRYSGLSGRVRLLWGQLTEMLGSKEPPAYSRAWEARLELKKMPSVIQDRAGQLANPKLTPEARIELEQELGSLEDQAAGHAKTLADMKADQENGVPLEKSRGFEPGKGYVAAEGVSKTAQEAKAAGLPMEEGYYWRKQGGKWVIVRLDPNLPKLRWNPDTKTLETVPDPPPKPPKPAATSTLPTPAPGTGPPPLHVGPNVSDARTAKTGGVTWIDEIPSNPLNESEVVVCGKMLGGMNRKLAPNYNREQVWSQIRAEHPELKLDTWEAAHLEGPGFGDEAAAGMRLAPREVNQIWQNQQVERFMRELRDMAAAQGLEVHYKLGSRSQERSFAGGVGDALLQSAEYEFSLAEPGATLQVSPGGRPRLPGKLFGKVAFSVDLPPGGKVRDVTVMRLDE